MENSIVWHIGCSGFHYKEWKETFYPKGLAQRKWFDYYSTRFNTLELNVSFYRFPQLSTLEGWYQKSPAGFTFSMKAPRLITHYKKFNDTQSLLQDFYSTAREGLKEKLGPILFQFPGQFTYDEEKLHQIVEQLDNSFTNVLEFRHAGWWRQDVYQLLAKHKIVFCGMSHPTLPDETVINTPTVYYRFHGTPRLYYSEYDTAFLERIKNEITTQPKVQTAWLYFNNTAALAAIHNAGYLRDQLSFDINSPLLSQDV
jgi:uncharacterized protein YecE (DUF72 family)